MAAQGQMISRQNDEINVKKGKNNTFILQIIIF